MEDGLERNFFGNLWEQAMRSLLLPWRKYLILAKDGTDLIVRTFIYLFFSLGEKVSVGGNNGKVAPLCLEGHWFKLQKHHICKKVRERLCINMALSQPTLPTLTKWEALCSLENTIFLFGLRNIVSSNRTISCFLTFSIA